MSDRDVRGKSLLDLLWEQLDGFVDNYQALSAKATNWDTRNQAAEMVEARGRAHAAAVCVALVANPYSPQVDAVKAEAMERWELRGEESALSVRTHNERSTSDHLAELEERREERRARRLARRQARRNS